MKHTLYVGLLSLLLAGCIDITHVQTGYVGDRDECRGRAETNASVYTQPESYGLSEKERSTALLQLFCECMKDKDWKVAGCPKPPTPPVAVAQAAPGPTVVVVQSPASEPAILPAPAPAPAPSPVKGTRKAKYCPMPTTTVCTAPPDNAAYQPPAQESQQLQGILQRQ